MGKMTKIQIQERQHAIWNEMDEMQTRSREANNGEIKFECRRSNAGMYSIAHF